MLGTATNLSLGADTKRTYYANVPLSPKIMAGVLLDIARDVPMSATTISSKVLSVDIPLAIGT
jgi:hypothetical protein